LLARRKFTQSMSQRGSGYAHAESFWSRLKTELLDGGRFAHLAEVRLEVSHYYIACHNAERRHSARGHLAPHHFKTRLQTMFCFYPA